MTTVRDYRQYSGEIIPTVLNGHWGTRLRAAPAFMLDSMAEACRWALTLTWLRRGEPIPDDALVALARQRNLELYAGNTLAQHRERVDGAWQTWQNSGGPVEIVNQLAQSGWPGAVVYYQFSADLPVEDPPDWWSQFWVFFPYGTHPVTAGSPKWGEFQYGDGTVYGLQGLTVPQIRLLRAIVRKWKPGNWICRHILFELSEDGADEAPFDVARLSV